MIFWFFQGKFCFCWFYLGKFGSVKTKNFLGKNGCLMKKQKFPRSFLFFTKKTIFFLGKMCFFNLVKPKI